MLHELLARGGAGTWRKDNHAEVRKDPFLSTSQDTWPKGADHLGRVPSHPGLSWGQISVFISCEAPNNAPPLPSCMPGKGRLKLGRAENMQSIFDLSGLERKFRGLYSAYADRNIKPSNPNPSLTSLRRSSEGSCRRGPRF